MPKAQLKFSRSEELRAALETLPGVQRALVEGPPFRVYLVCQTISGAPPMEVAAQAVLAEQGIAPGAAELHVSYLTEAGAPRRVRFVEIQLQRPHVGSVVAEVTLEWGDQLYRGRADGEGGAACELRVCGQATVRALEEVVAGAVTLNLVGSKAIRIFDNDLVAVLLNSPQAPDRRLIGVSLVSVDCYRSAAVAVLNATNRLLGNFLHTSD